MSSNKSSKSTPINDGNNSIISICFDAICAEVTNVTYISEIDGEIKFKRSEGLLFHVILNADILSIIPKVDIKINNKDVVSGNMYILDIADTVTCIGKQFYFKESELVVDEISSTSNDIPPDITQEIKISSLTNRTIEDYSEEIEEIEKKKKFDLSKIKKIFKLRKKPKEFKTKETHKKEKENLSEGVGRNTALLKLDKEKSSLSNQQKSANPLVRVLALILDLAMSFILLEFIVIDTDVLSFIKIEELIDLSKFEFAKEFIQKSMSVSLSFYVLRIIGSLVFGVSLGQVLLGMSSKGSVLGKRIKAPFREILGVLTGGLFIFDLSCLFGKRTLKELLTGSKVVTSGFIKTFVLFLLAYSLVFVLWVSLPILNAPISLKKLNVSQAFLNPSKKISVDYFKKSNFFNFSIDSENEILPFFYYKRSGKSIVGRPEIEFFYGKEKSSIKFIKKIDFRKVLDNVKENNLTIKNFFPEVATILFDKKIRSFNRPSIKEIMKITNESFNLNLDTLFEHILTRGPFVRPYLNYRVDLETTINSNFTSISYDNIANHPYMIFHKTKNSKRVMGLSLSEANIFDIQSRDKKFNKRILPLKIDGTLQDSLLTVVDILYQKQFSNEKLSQAFEISFEFLKASLVDEIKIDKNKIVSSFESQLNYLNLIKRTVKDETSKLYIDKYVQNLSDLIRAYKDQDRVYFGEDNAEVSTEQEIDIKSEEVESNLELIKDKVKPKGNVHE